MSFTAPHGPLQPKKGLEKKTAHIPEKKRRNYAGLVVSLVVMTPFIALSVYIFRRAVPGTPLWLRIRIGAGALILMGVAMIAFFAIQSVASLF